MTKGLLEINKKCEWCGKDFIAYKVNTRFCSKACNSRAYKDRMRRKRVDKCEDEVKQSFIFEDAGQAENREFLSVAQAAYLLGVDKRTMYRYLADNIIKSYQFKGKTIVRRKDIDAIFDAAPIYIKRHKKEKKPITEFYTFKEIIEKFNISEGWFFKAVSKNKTPKVTKNGRTYYSRTHIDQLFSTSKEIERISEWCTADEVMEKYGMSRVAVYSFVWTHNIPKKKEKGQTYYSKADFDKAKNIDGLGANKPGNANEPQYYSVKEACAKFNVTRDMLYKYVKNNKLPKVNEGRIVKYEKEPLDRFFEEFFAPPTIEQ